MTFRVAEQQLSRRSLTAIFENKARIEKFSNELSTGIKVQEPGDSNYSGTIAQFKDTLARLDKYKNAGAQAQSQLQFQDDIMNQMNEILIRAKEIATQGANETHDATTRASMSNELFAIRDQIVNLANSTYQGKYIFGGAQDGTPPIAATTNYTNSSGGADATRYIFNSLPGSTTTRSVDVADGVNVVINSSAQNLFVTSIGAVERLGRALNGYDSTLTGGLPDGGGAAFVFPQEYSLQTQAILGSIDALNTARTDEIIPERSRLGGEMKRIDNGVSMIELIKANTEDILNDLQNVDEADAATKLSLAQTALQASYSVTAKSLNLTILNYL